MDAFHSPLDVLPPTEAEVASLTSPLPSYENPADLGLNNHNSLDVLQNPVQPPLMELLQEVFHLCRDQWVINFLYSNDISPLSVWTAPLNLNATAAASVNATSAERISTAAPQLSTSFLFDSRMAGEFIFIPAFSVGELTVGFGVVHYTVLCRAEWGRDPKYASRRGEHGHIRFVRNDVTRSLAISFEDAKADVIKFDLFSELSSAIRKHVTITFRRSKFLNIINNQAVLDLVQAARSTVLMIHYNMEKRVCLACKSVNQYLCSCERIPNVPKHSLDFSYSRSNMAIHGGSFEGVSATSLYDGYTQVFTTSVAHRVSATRCNNRELVTRLARWAICDQLRKTPQNPIQDYLLIMEPFLNPKECSDNAGNRSTHGTKREISEEYATVGNEMPLEPNGNGSIVMDEQTEHRQVQNWQSGNAKMSKEFDSTQGCPYVPEAGADNAEDDAHQYANSKKDLRLNLRAGLEVDIENGSQQVKYCEDVNVSGLGFDFKSRMGGGLESADSSGISDEARQSSVLWDKEQEREMKKELRKKRNREAAQRSNLRRKLRNDTLKDNLSASRSKAAILRRREQTLREENLRLRRLLSNGVNEVVCGNMENFRTTY